MNGIKRGGHAYGFALLCVAAISISQFLLFYIPAGFFYENDALLVASSYITNLLEMIISPLCATVIFLTRGGGVRTFVPHAFLFAAVRLCYSVPYYYIYYVSDVFDSIEAIMLAFLVSILFIVFSALQIFVCIITIYFVSGRSKANYEEPRKSGIFDVDDQTNFAILLSSLFIFIIFLVREIINTVSYLTDSRGTYRTEEILMLIFAYVLLIVFLIITYAVCAITKNKILKKEL